MNLPSWKTFLEVTVQIKVIMINLLDNKIYVGRNHHFFDNGVINMRCLIFY